MAATDISFRFIGGLLCVLAASAHARDRLQDPVIDFVAKTRASGKLLRIDRDFNNDGQSDMALAEGEGCGQKTCSFVVYLRQPSGRYVVGGQIGGLPHGYRLKPLSDGTAIWEACSVSGERVSMTTVVIDQRRVSEPRNRVINPTRADVMCRLQVSYEWEECDLRLHASARQCKWERKYWTP
ncbi:MAG: hypothetical protein RL758_540 [Pseudomonadota bacterium]|jgi:hypothetical protein